MSAGSTAMWSTVTHLGNSTLLGPCALVLALWLASARQWRLAAAWTAGFGAAVALVLASKLAFLGWGIGIAAIDFTGISGHATVSTAVFTMAAWLLAAHRNPRVQALAVGAGLLVGVLVSASRVALHAHSTSEVAAGFVLGAACALLPVAAVGGHTPRLGRRWVPVAMAAVLGLVPQMGRPAETHGLVVQMALVASGRTAVYHRAMLHHPPP